MSFLRHPSIALMSVAALAGVSVFPRPACADTPTAETLEPIGFVTVSGERVSLPDQSAKATAFVFVSSTCPIANGYAPEINRMAKQFGPDGIKVVVVHTEANLDDKAAQKHKREFGYECPVIIDSTLRLTRHSGATITPEAALYTRSGELVYRGRIDDRFPDIGIQRDQPTKTELRDAIRAVIRGEPVAVSRTKAVGCYIELP